MERTWMNVGKEYNASDKQKKYLARAFDGLEWQSIKGGLEIAAIPGLAIKAAIRELPLPKVSHVATSNALAPYGLYGIRAHYRNGQADVYILDEGSRSLVLASDFWPKKVA